MINDSKPTHLEFSPWQSLTLPQKNHIIHLVAELVQRQLTKQTLTPGGCHEHSLSQSRD